MAEKTNINQKLINILSRKIDICFSKKGRKRKYTWKEGFICAQYQLDTFVYFSWCLEKFFNIPPNFILNCLIGDVDNWDSPYVRMDAFSKLNSWVNARCYLYVYSCHGRRLYCSWFGVFQNFSMCSGIPHLEIRRMYKLFFWRNNLLFNILIKMKVDQTIYIYEKLPVYNSIGGCLFYDRRSVFH